MHRDTIAGDRAHTRLTPAARRKRPSYAPQGRGCNDNSLSFIITRYCVRNNIVLYASEKQSGACIRFDKSNETNCPVLQERLAVRRGRCYLVLPLTSSAAPHQSPMEQRGGLSSEIKI
ncbi:hypothetical protein EVAR_8178_1 [Eumeta japonica]|uniref:Uncharacterized protein n=1 Tax=Eumeta variegata TaxID=151549 RepID=A0A4C1TIN0_EUMVA|nr:hypothetical protein EVAR_8178_1 [Eumeta japonica]